MNIHTRAQPAPGDAQAGDLYVDVQTREIWLGVATSLDPTGSVLISDIEALQEADIQTLADAKLYADTGLAGKAPVVHTHTASQITDFTAAVQAVVGGGGSASWIKGMITLWSGQLSAIGVGALAGWALCDGNNGTPDLRDRFIIGAGNILPGVKNSAASATTSQDPGHTHAITGVALTAAQLAPHTHGVTIGPNRFYGATYGGAGGHTHGIHIWGNSNDAGGHVRNEGTEDRGIGAATEAAGSHDHSCYVDIHAGYNSDTGAGVAGQAHTHTESIAGVHTHTVTQQALREATPYYALAYIMKL